MLQSARGRSPLHRSAKCTPKRAERSTSPLGEPRETLRRGTLHLTPRGAVGARGTRSTVLAPGRSPSSYVPRTQEEPALPTEVDAGLPSRSAEHEARHHLRGRPPCRPFRWTPHDPASRVEAVAAHAAECTTGRTLCSPSRRFSVSRSVLIEGRCQLAISLSFHGLCSPSRLRINRCAA